MANVTTTGGKAIKKPFSDSVTIYGPTGAPHVCAPVDAREILLSANGYTAEPPAPNVAKVADEHNFSNPDAPKGAASALATETDEKPQVKRGRPAKL